MHSQSREEMLDMMLSAERDRREMAWEMTRELFRLREVVERQQAVVARLVETVTNNRMTADTAAPSGPGEHGGRPQAGPAGKSEDHETLLERQQELQEELERLKATLEDEREVVDRLRRSKLELERRAAQAEETLEILQRRGFVQRLLGRRP